MYNSKKISIFFLNKLKWNILLKRKNNSSRTRCAKLMNHPNLLQTRAPMKGYHHKTRKLHNIHTTKRVSPPVMITKSNRNKMRRQPKKWVHLHLFKNTVDIDYRIFEDTVVSIFPNCPNTRKPNNFEIRMSSSRERR